MGESVRRLSLEGLATDRTLSPSGVEMMGAKSGRSAQQKDGMQQDGKQQVKSQQATTQQKYEDALRRSIKRANEAEDMKNAEELVSKLQVMKDEAQQIVFQMQGSPLPGQATERSKSVSDVLDFPGKQTLNLNKEALESRPATGDSATRLLRLDEQATKGTTLNKTLAERIVEMEHMATVISCMSGLSCLLALIIREYRVSSNVTWEDTADCMAAVKQGHKCNYAPAVVEVLRGFLGLAGLASLVRVYPYFQAHVRLEEEALGDPLHTRPEIQKTLFYLLYFFEVLILLPWNPPFSNYRLYTQAYVDTVDEGGGRGMWHADDVGAVVGLLRLLSCMRSLKHVLWRRSETHRAFVIAAISGYPPRMVFTAPFLAATTFETRPLEVLGAVYVTAILWLGAIVHIAENPAPALRLHVMPSDPVPESGYEDALWAVMRAWVGMGGNVSRSEELPLSRLAQGVCVIAMWMGTLWCAMLVVALVRLTSLQTSDVALRHQLERAHALQTVRHEAATLISHWWRFHRFHAYCHITPSHAGTEHTTSDNAVTAAKTASYGAYVRGDRLVRRRLMRTPMGVARMPLVMQDAYEQREVDHMRLALRTFKEAGRRLKRLRAPGGTPEQLLLAMDIDLKLADRALHQRVTTVSEHAAATAAQQHANVMQLINDTSSVSLSLASEASVRMGGLETRSIALEESQAALGVEVHQVAGNLNSLHSVMVARLAGLEEMLQRLAHKADVSRGDVTAHATHSAAGHEHYDTLPLPLRSAHASRQPANSDTFPRTRAPSHELGSERSDHSSAARADDEAASAGQRGPVADGLATGNIGMMLATLNRTKKP